MTRPGRSRAIVVGVVAAVVVVAAAVVTWIMAPSRTTSGIAVGGPAQATATSAKTPCDYKRTTEWEIAKDVGLPGNADRVPAEGTVRATLKTGDGDVQLTMDRAKAPCSVYSLLFLAENKYYDNSPCHRLTTSPTLKVLQCGDPTGSGRGGPGYVYNDLDPTGLATAGAGTVVYPKGTIAMANAGPGTNGSQFFLVYEDTVIPPSYAVMGTYSDPGKAIEQIVAAGINPSPGIPEEMGDGSPKKPVTIQRVTIP